MKRNIILTLLIVVVLVASGSVMAQDDATINIGLSGEPSSLDVRNYSLTASTFAVMWQIFEPLMYHDTRTDELIPGLATSFEQVDEDSYLFNLRQDVTWHDGEPFNAEDVVFSFARNTRPIQQFGLDPENPVEIVDDHTVIVNTNGPSGPFLKQNLPLNMIIIPEHIIAPLYEEAANAEYEETTDEEGNVVTAEAAREAALRSIENGENWSEPEYVGTGPFSLESWDRGEQITLVANESYWGGTPNIDRLVYSFVEDNTSRVIGLESGDFDLILGLPETDVERLQGVDNVEVLVNPSLGYHMLTMNQATPGLDNVLVRQAIAYAIDQQEIISLYGDLAIRTCGPLSTRSGFYNADVNCFDYNPDRARELLEEAGWDGSITFQLKTLSSLVDEAILIEFYLEEVGINVDIQEVDAGSYYSEVRSGESELALYSFDNVSDPDHIYWVFHNDWLGGSIFSYNNATTNDLLITGQQTVDTDTRQELYGEAQRLIVDEDTVAVFMYSYSTLRAFRSDRISGIEQMPRPTDVFYFLRTAEIAG